MIVGACMNRETGEIGFAVTLDPADLAALVRGEVIDIALPESASFAIKAGGASATTLFVVPASDTAVLAEIAKQGVES